MKHATTCQFCHANLVIEIDDAYSKLGDPFKLLKFSACNQCADLRSKRRTLEDGIKTVCLSLLQYRGRVPTDAADKARDALRRLTQSYSKLVAEWHGLSGLAWDSGIPDLFISNPDKWATLLGNVWSHYKAEAKPKAA